MAFNPNLPANNAEVVSAELRNQFNALKALIDAQQAQINALQSALSLRAAKPTMGEFDPGFSDPPSFTDLLNIQAVINDLLSQLENG
jgi:hypothetical protein